MKLTADQQKLAAENTGLVSVAFRRVPSAERQLGRDEARSICLMELCRATVTYRPELGFAFTTYAVACMRHKLINQMRVHTLDRERVKRSRTARIDREFYDEVGWELERADLIDRLINVLHGKERELLTRLLAGESRRQVAESWGCSKERTRQILVSAIAKMKEVLA